MKKKFFSFFAVLTMVLSIVSLSACEESTPDENGGDSNSWSELKGNVVTLNDQATQYVESYENDSIITFSSSTPDNLIPSVGSILYVPVSEKTPYGYLGKISKVDKSGGYKVFTESASLDEVFGNLSVDGNIESIDAIEEVVDAEGNPVEFELVDSLFQETGTKASAVSRTGEFYLKDKLIRFPFSIYSGEAGNKSIKLSGNVYAGFKNFSLSIDINNNSTSYVDLNLTPCIGLNATSVVKLAGGKKEIKDFLIGKMTLRATIPTPAIIPIIVPITLYVYGTCGASGEITATLSFKPEYSTNWNIKFKNDQWTCDKKDSPARNPWEASGFEVKGEIYSGTKLGVLVGLYSATSGIGINIIPNYSIGCSASITAENILNINPLVDQTLKISSEAYCVAKFFGKQLAKATFHFPDYILWNEKVYLLPQYSDFNAIGNGTHGEISYKIDQHYFLKFLGFKHGLTIFDSDEKTELETAYPSSTKLDERGYNHYNHTTTELSGGKTYYASPTIFGMNKKFHGEKYEFTIQTNNLCPDENHPHWIDLGLPSGTLWSCCNAGASKPEEYGSYFRNSDINEISFAPSRGQIEELISHSGQLDITINGVKGRQFKGRNGNKIFFPCAGEYHTAHVTNDKEWSDRVGQAGFYRSSTTYYDYYSTLYTYGLYFEYQHGGARCTSTSDCWHINYGSFDCIVKSLRQVH